MFQCIHQNFRLQILIWSQTSKKESMTANFYFVQNLVFMPLLCLNSINSLLEKKNQFCRNSEKLHE